jgi:hypothetical protein
MRAITLHAPWAWAIAHGPKRVENRTWKPPSALLGQRIAIHAGRGLGTVGERESCILALLNTGIDPPDEWPQSRVLCTARLQGWIALDGSFSSEVVRYAYDSEWFCGPVGWVLEAVQAVPGEPSCGGERGLWAYRPPPAAASNRRQDSTEAIRRAGRGDICTRR